MPAARGFAALYSGLGAMVLASFLCALGCFLRGLARNVSDLYAAAAILGLGGSSLDLVVLTYLGAVLRRGRQSPRTAVRAAAR